MRRHRAARAFQSLADAGRALGEMAWVRKQGAMPFFERPRPWWLAAAMAMLVGALAAIFRLLSLRGLPNDHYMHMVWAQQLLSGELPGRDFVDPGMPLTYTLSAAIQYWWPGPFSEAVLGIAMLAVASGVTCLLTARLTGSVTVGAVAGLFLTATYPRLYSYPKLLVPAVALLLLHRYARAPSRGRLAALAGWTAVAALLRHDLGVYVALAIPFGLGMLHWPNLLETLKSSAWYAAATAIALAPYATYVQLTEGLAEHIRVGAEFSKVDANQFVLALPAFSWLQTGDVWAWNVTDSATLLAHVGRLLVPLGLVLAVRRREIRDIAVIATVTGALVMLGGYVAVILRHPLVARVPDVAALLGIVGAWTCVELVRGVVATRGLVPVVGGITVAALMAGASAGSAWQLGGVQAAWSETRVVDGFAKVRESFGDIRQAGTVWPWVDFWPQGELPEVVYYLNRCTRPSQRLLLTWFAPEYYYFSRRAFGGGLGLLYPGRAFVTARDQELMVSRMRERDVPIVLINESRDRVSGYPLLDTYLQQQYEAAGRFTIRDDSEITVAVRRDLRATGSYGAYRWPCGFETNRVQSASASAPSP